MTQYIALLHKTRSKGYGVSFPDFPGCVSAGNTRANAVRNGAEALALHADGLSEDGVPIPEPRSVQGIREAAHDWVDLQDAIVAKISLRPPQL